MSQRPEDDPFKNIFDLAITKPAKTVEELRESLGFELTEDGIARAFASRYVDRLRYDHDAQHWFEWTGSYWRPEKTKLAFSWSREICRELGRTAEAKDKFKIGKAAFADAVERFAQSDRGMVVTAEAWDRDPWLLGTPDGTVELRTGHMRKADAADHMTKRTTVSPASPGTPHPLWDKFLAETTNGDTELIAFLQRLAGYILTGKVNEEVLAFFYGEGGTGKGTLLRTWVAILGEYAISVPTQVFTAGSRLNLEYHRASMAGARLVTASETEQGAAWAESQIKELTGNEAPLSGRHPYGRPFTFHPTFKIVFVGNHAPRLKGRSKAMERRTRVCPFLRKPAVVDTALKEKLEVEHTAILRWMLDGCVLWQQIGLGTCTAVTSQTESYFEQQDAFGRWRDERCVLGGTLSSTSGLLLADFNTWAKANGEEALRSNDFAEIIDRMDGLKRERTNRARLVKGLTLRLEGDASPTQRWE